MANAYWVGRYEAWRQRCPQAYDLFVEFARQVKARGFTHFSACAIVHRIRWEVALERPDGEGFKINHNFAKYLGDELMRTDPEFAGFFRTRRNHYTEGTFSG